MEHIGTTILNVFTGGYYAESSPAVAGGVVYVGSTNDGKLYAFDAVSPAASADIR